MIWEFRDVVETLVARCGVERTLDFLFGEQAEGEERLDRLFQDWGKDTDLDDSTSAALLDILTILADAYMIYDARSQTTQKCLRMAQGHAARLVDKDGRFAKSRPYLKLVLVKLMARDWEERMDFTNILFRGVSRGELIVRHKGLFKNALPVYVPFNEETPRWEPRSHQRSEEAMRAVAMVQQAAMDADDLRMQAACLQEQIWHISEGPEGILEKLHKLWSDAGHLGEIRDMHLFKYMLVRTAEARRDLRVDILTAGEFTIANDFQYARYMILRALTTQNYEKDWYLRQASQLPAMTGFPLPLSQPISTVNAQHSEVESLPSSLRSSGMGSSLLAEYDGKSHRGRINPVDAPDNDPRSRSNNKTNEPALLSYEEATRLRPNLGASQSQLPIRQLDQQKPRGTGSIVAEKAPDSPVTSRHGLQKRLEDQIQEVRTQMDSVHHDDEKAMTKLKEKRRRLLHALLELEDGGAGKGKTLELGPDDSVSNAEKKPAGNKFATVEDYEGSSDEDDARPGGDGAF